MAEYKTYDDIFEEMLRETWHQVLAPENAVPQIIDMKLKAQGVILTDAQLVLIRERVQERGGDFKFELDKDQLLEAGIEPNDAGDYQLTIDLTDVAERLDKFEAELPRLLEVLIDEVSEEWSKQTLEAVLDSAKSTLLEEQKERDSFKTQLRDIWGEALDTLELMLILVTSVSQDFATDYEPVYPDEPDYVFQVLVGLHARACQIGKEIHNLLSGGFAAGAHARWRSLHEVAVVASFIQDKGQEVAERYLLHEAIESRKAAHQHKRYSDRINEPPPTDKELQQLDETYQILLKRFGKPFTTPNGWAAEELKARNPNFADIERNTGLDHFRPFYKLASHNVHANPLGMLFRLGSAPDARWLLAGPSIYGLTDPGHGTAISLLQITSCLVSHQPSIDRMVKIRVLMEIERKVGDTFLDAANDADYV